MHAIARRTLAGLAVFAAPALASAQPISFTNAFGATVRDVASGYAGLAATEGADYQLLASHDCVTLGVGVCNPTNNIQQGNGTWNYAPYAASLANGVPTVFTGSVATTTFTIAGGAGLFGFDLALLFNPTNLVPGDDFEYGSGRDFALVRLFQGASASGPAAIELLFQLSGPNTVDVSAAGFFGSPGVIGQLPLVATGDNVFARTTGWLSVPQGLPLPDGQYTLEFGVADQGNKDYVVGLAIDNVRGPQAVIPEPSTYALLGAGLAGVLGVARRRRSA